MDPEGKREPYQPVYGRAHFAALNRTDIPTPHLGLIRQIVLRDPGGFADLTYACSKRLPIGDVGRPRLSTRTLHRSHTWTVRHLKPRHTWPDIEKGRSRRMNRAFRAGAAALRRMGLVIRALQANKRLSLLLRAGGSVRVRIGLVALVGIATLLTGCGEDEFADIEAKQRRDLIDRGCAVPGSLDGDDSIEDVIDDGLANPDSGPIRDKNGDYCPGGEEREARQEAAEAKASVEASEAASYAAFEAQQDEETRRANADLALSRLKEARTRLAAMRVEDFRGSLPDAQTAFESEQRKVRKEIADLEATLRSLNEPIPPE